MSSKTKKIAKNVADTKSIMRYDLENSLAGSAICTIGKLVGKKEDDLIEEFTNLKKSFPTVNNVKEMVDYLIDYFKMPEEYKNDIVLIYDEHNFYTPIVTLCIDSVYLPISESGFYPAIMRKINDDSIVVEFIYKEDEDETD